MTCRQHCIQNYKFICHIFLYQSFHTCLNLFITHRHESERQFYSFILASRSNFCFILYIHILTKVSLLSKSCTNSTFSGTSVVPISEVRRSRIASDGIMLIWSVWNLWFGWQAYGWTQGRYDHQCLYSFKVTGK